MPSLPPVPNTPLRDDPTQNSIWKRWLQLLKQSYSGLGTVTSVAVSGGTTGLTTSGGPITTSGTITLTGTLIAANGGTGIASYAVGDILYAATTTTLAKLADVATGNALISGGVNTAPSWGKIDLTTHVTGDLPYANLAQGSALSVLGVTGNAAADVASIAAASDAQVLRRSGTAVAFGAVDLSSSNAVTGALTVTNGGTGVATLTGIPLGSGISAFSALAYTDWTTPAFDAGVFTASGSMTWGVGSGDVNTYAYMIIDKTMFFAFYLQTTTISGTPSNVLKIKLPASKTATKAMRNTVFITNAGVTVNGQGSVSASGTVLNIFKNDASNFATETDATEVFGQIFIQIN